MNPRTEISEIDMSCRKSVNLEESASIQVVLRLLVHRCSLNHPQRSSPEVGSWSRMKMSESEVNWDV